MADVTVATIRLLGGHPALDFTNTVDSRGAVFGPDVLNGFQDLLDWAERVGLVETAAPLRELPAKRAEAALARAKTLREALYRIFATPASTAPADLDALQEAVRAAQATRTLTGGPHGFGWRWRSDDPDIVTHHIALAAADLLTSSALDRVHVCPGEDCAWLFLDTSRNGRRIWCRAEGCGTRQRVRRWRARHKEGCADV